MSFRAIGGGPTGKAAGGGMVGKVDARGGAAKKEAVGGRATKNKFCLTYKENRLKSGVFILTYFSVI
jgi:hypothetical protein